MNTLMITGGFIEKDFVLKLIHHNKYDNIVAVDGGLEFAKSIGVTVDRVIGDFDTVDYNLVQEYLAKGTVVSEFNSDKDYTDTHLALKIVIQNGSKSVDIVGGLGSRFDHTLANVHVLKLGLEHHVSCRLINKTNVIQLVDSELVIKEKVGRYLSLIPLTTFVKGINTEGLVYPLKDGELSIGQSIGISNEILGNSAKIYVKEGILIVIQSTD